MFDFQKMSGSCAIVGDLLQKGPDKIFDNRDELISTQSGQGVRLAGEHSLECLLEATKRAQCTHVFTATRIQFAVLRMERESRTTRTVKAP
jgi:hypothetical protein